MEIVIVDGGGKVTQERMADADGTKFTAKEKAKKSSDANKNKVDEKRKS